MNFLRFLVIVFLGPISCTCNGQTCNYAQLSNKFDFEIKLLRSDKTDSCQIILSTFDKATTKKIQEINIQVEDLNTKVFKNCKEVRSYSTGFNKDLLIGEENDYGDLIIADFNFDEKEDIAIKIDVGVSGGPSYIYYFQGENKHFDVSNYLNNTIRSFPVMINQKSKTLTTLVHANTYERCKTVYHYNSKAKKWKIISTRFVKY